MSSAVFADKREALAYRQASERLHYKSVDALIDGFIRHHYRPIVESLEHSEIVNPLVSGLPASEVFIRWLGRSETDQIRFLGHHMALTGGDWESFLGAQFTAGRLAYQHDTRAYLQAQTAGGPWGSGTDRSLFAISAVCAFGGCDAELAKAYLPSEEGLTSAGHRFAVALGNLVMALLYKDPVWMGSAVAQATKVAGLKGTGVAERATLHFLIAVLREDMGKAGERLQEVMERFRQAGWLHDYRDPLSKFCPQFAYGLYFAAKYFLSDRQFAELAQPGHFLWRREYTAFCGARHYVPVKDWVSWRGDVVFLNDELEDLERWRDFPQYCEV